MAKAMRKEFFAWDDQKLSHLMNIYLGHAGWEDIRISSTKVTARIKRSQKVTEHAAVFEFKLEARMTPQGDGTNVIVTVEEPHTEWSKFICDAFCVDMLAAMHVLYDFERE